jgi:hypothetical protein
VIVVSRCIGAKANVLHCVGFELGDAALLILLKRWHFVFHFTIRLLSVVVFFTLSDNAFITVIFFLFITVICSNRVEYPYVFYCIFDF